MPKIGRDREEGWSLMGTIFLRGLSRIVFWDVCPTLTVLRFQHYYNDDRIFKLFVSEEL